MTATGEPDPDSLPGQERMVAFIDASVAIALTLLVLQLTELVPSGDRPAGSATEVITGNLPVFGSFLLSFAVIGRFWLVHHRLFGFGGPLTRPLVVLNLFWVLTIVVLPFTTQMVSTYGSQPFVLRLYTGVLAVCSGLLTTMAVLMRRTGIARGDLRRPADVFVTRMIAATGNVLLAFLLAVVVPALGYWVMFALVLDPISTRLIARIRRTTFPTRPARG